MGTSRVGIVTESVATVPAADVQRLGIEVVPLPVRFGTEEFLDGADLSAEDFYRRMVADEVVPTTSAPSPDAYEQACRRALAAGADELIVLTLAASLSAAHEAAVAGTADLEVPVHVIDTGTAAAAEGILVRYCAELVASGAPAAEAVAAVEQIRDRVVLYAVIPTLTYLRRGGRVGRLRGFAGDRLGIRPLVCLRGGEVGGSGVVRRMDAGFDRMVELVRRAGQGAAGLEVVVTHANAPEDAATLAARFDGVGLRRPVDVVPFTPVMGAHTGPGAVGLAYGAFPAQAPLPPVAR
ncbi:DegV family protein [Quadrisphaera sp. GCM10027208]|uniref:DegV family protein n=1 Tax=Quadrisphaera sp. GCM10027208 TaxID=3273423 RepID=UPI0036206329|nr:DegV family protein [Kineosporiaceae bacterium SCSIO 59966]